MIDVAKAGEHVADATYFEIPKVLWQYLPGWMHGEHPHPGAIPLPKFTLDLFGRTLEFQVTKFMVLELIVALAMIAIFVPLAARLRNGQPARGRIANLFEMVLVFIRDEMAKPAIGHGAERYLPYLWTVFFFILFCNLIGLVPWAGSPTGSLSVTAVLASMTLATVLGSGITKFGALRFWKSLVPHMELPLLLAVVLKPMILVLEVVGLAIRHTVLAIRLLANMFAGHLVLAVILLFIAATAPSALWYGVMPASVLGAVALNLLELLVAFLQAYIFTFLSALFIGMVVHPH
jgi:F-type H+-transporting ATPase subunit a